MGPDDDELREYIAIKRRATLSRCLRLRALIAKANDPNEEPPVYPVSTTIWFLKMQQKHLLKYRIMRVTGHYPEDN